MPFGETKVYFDGSHYIAIPHTVRFTIKKPKPLEEKITVIQDEVQDSTQNVEPCISLEETEFVQSSIDDIKVENESEEQMVSKPKIVKHETKMTRKELFNELYKKHINLNRKKRSEAIIKEMLPYFKNQEQCSNYVFLQMQRKQRNLICRRVRMIRKANLVDFNYFCTFTYDDKLHTEETFRKQLKKTFENYVTRRGWKYMGVWERAPETNRLHFHGLFAIPEGKMKGELFEKKDYDTVKHRMQVSIQNTYFNERFGRTDFKEIDTHQDLMREIQYICKYLEKTEEKIVYSKGLYQYFISDIFDEDIVCRIGQEDKKLLLFDDFKCWDEGVLMGRVSPEVIAQMRKSN